ncbi:PBSX family phage terminase large subunit [Helcococcus kunzii]|uniref:PBSX family phage terminase large subunit n=1 Tax=Helcococcus kunzii TaxID=40091 RepID=UPI0038B12959
MNGVVAMSKVVNIQKEVNPNFEVVWKSDRPYNILKGGRNSFKSSVISLLLVYKMIYHIKKKGTVNIVVMRKVANTIRDSVFNKIQWAINVFGLSNEFKATVSPFKIVHVKSKSTFYFYGQDDFQKLKSNDILNVIAVWYEEAAEFNDYEEFDQTNITFMRQKPDFVPFVYFYWSYNPPRNPYSWINKWAEDMKNEPDYLVHESSYLDDKLGFVTVQMLADIERIKRNDYDYYRYIYLGEPVGLGDNVYNIDLFNKLDKLPDDERIIKLYFASDTGHSISATTTLAFGYTTKKNIILLDTQYYSPQGKVNKKSPEQLCKDMRNFYVNTIKKYPYPIVKKTVDSADGAIRNQYFNMYGERLHPVSKEIKVNMIDYVIDLLSQGRFFYLGTENNKIFVEEHRQYRWDEKSIENNPDNPRVIKVDDHTCDAFQYFVKDNLRDLGLKF